jgi:hypothetical protein
LEKGKTYLLNLSNQSDDGIFRSCRINTFLSPKKAEPSKVDDFWGEKTPLPTEETPQPEEEELEVMFEKLSTTEKPKVEKTKAEKRGPSTVKIEQPKCQSLSFDLFIIYHFFQLVLAKTPMKNSNSAQLKTIQKLTILMISPAR